MKHNEGDCFKLLEMSWCADRIKQSMSIYHIYPTPPLELDMTQGQFFKRNLTGLNSEFSFS